MTKIDGLEIVMTKQMQKMIDKELKKRFEELKPELATRYEELLNMRNMEADQFNDGFNDARAGKLETDHPHYDLDTDNWRLGYAYGMFEPMKEKLAREHQLSDALYLLLVDDPNTKLKAEQILIDIYGKREPSKSDVSVTQDVTTDDLRKRIAELEAENNRLAELLHNELSSVEIATDAYRDLERKCKALEAENAAMKKDLKARIAELEAEQRWIPVGERLPEESDWTLIRYKGYRVPYTLYYDIDRGWACGETPDYWMSLPEMQEVNNE